MNKKMSRAKRLDGFDKACLANIAIGIIAIIIHTTCLLTGYNGILRTVSIALTAVCFILSISALLGGLWAFASMDNKKQEAAK